MICRVLAAEIFERFAYLLSLSMTMSSRFYLCYASQDPSNNNTEPVPAKDSKGNGGNLKEPNQEEMPTVDTEKEDKNPNTEPASAKDSKGDDTSPVGPNTGKKSTDKIDREELELRKESEFKKRVKTR